MIKKLIDKLKELKELLDKWLNEDQPEAAINPRTTL